LLKKDLRETFELINLDQKVKIFGFASEQFFRDFKEERYFFINRF